MEKITKYNCGPLELFLEHQVNTYMLQMPDCFLRFAIQIQMGIPNSDYGLFQET